jgi:dihydrofolate reductase
MRKLKLQMQMSVDGFVATSDGKPIIPEKLDPAVEIAMFETLTDTCDTILLGRKMGQEFVNYWVAQAANGTGKQHDYGVKAVRMQKVMFSRTVNDVVGENFRVENGPVRETVNALKRQRGKDIIVYGGANFVSSLIDDALIDELNLFINPVALGSGLQIFGKPMKLNLVTSKAYPSGIVMNTFIPKR